MPVPRLLAEAASRMEAASRRIEEARGGRANTEREWLEALTDLVLATADVQRFSNESVHEKLHELAARIGVKKFPAERPAPPDTSRG